MAWFRTFIADVRDIFFSLKFQDVFGIFLTFRCLSLQRGSNTFQKIFSSLWNFRIYFVSDEDFVVVGF